MSAPSLPELVGIEVEHLVGEATGLPLVKLRAQGLERGRTVVMVGQLEPDQARRIAGHLLEAAARAEYELDLITGIETAMEAKVADGGPAADFAAMALGFVRSGEVVRHTDTGGSAT